MSPRLLAEGSSFSLASLVGIVTIIFSQSSNLNDSCAIRCSCDNYQSGGAAGEDATRRVSLCTVMSGISNYLNLQNHSARRVGLTRTDLPSGRCQPKGYKYDSTPSPPPKDFKLHTLEDSKQDEAEEDILAPPASDSSDDEAYKLRTNIQPSTNIGKKEKTGKPASSRGKLKGPTINGNVKSQIKPKSTAPSQDNGPPSPKRKSQEDFGGGVWEKKKKRVKTQAKYGSQSSQGKGKGKSATNVMSFNNSEGLWFLCFCFP